MSSPDEKDVEQIRVEELLHYCRQRSIFFHQYAIPRRVPGRGLGIYASTRIAKGEKITHVPLAELFTALSIPEEFVTVKARKGIPTHALLAAFFAFGSKTVLGDYQPWLATWPRFSEFSQSVPLLWPKICYRPINGGDTVALPAPLTGSYAGSNEGKSQSRNGSTTLVSAQAAKLKSHIQSLRSILDEKTYEDLSTPNSATYYTFLHAWLCVNTRCFSYTPHGKSAPADPNEAMALCPGMDLFNHTIRPNVKTKHDRTGYHAVSTRDIEADEEICFSYGPHVNDVLWAEYGFLLEAHPDDAIRIDQIVLQGLSDKQKQMLQDGGYMNEFWLSANSICYCSEVVAWLSILDAEQWHDMLEGQYDPETDQNPAETGKRTAEGQCKRVRRGEANSKSHRTICASWAAKVVADAECAIADLAAMTDDAICDNFGDSEHDLLVQDIAFKAQSLKAEHYHAARQEQAKQRHAMCVMRWTQLCAMATAAQKKIVSV